MLVWLGSSWFQRKPPWLQTLRLLVRLATVKLIVVIKFCPSVMSDFIKHLLHSLGMSTASPASPAAVSASRLYAAPLQVLCSRITAEYYGSEL